MSSTFGRTTRANILKKQYADMFSDDYQEHQEDMLDHYANTNMIRSLPFVGDIFAATKTLNEGGYNPDYSKTDTKDWLYGKDKKMIEALEETAQEYDEEIYKSGLMQFGQLAFSYKFPDVA